MESSVRAVEEILKYTFRNQKLLEDALTHPSFSSSSFGRLEFIGDAALSLAFANFFYLLYPSLAEGPLHLLRSVNASNEKLARVAVRHRLYAFLLHNAPNTLTLTVNEFISTVENAMEEDKLALFGGDVKAPKVLADLVESIAAAVYIDSGYDLNVFWNVFKDLLEPIVTWEMVQEQPQPVTKLFHVCHKRKKQLNIKQWKENSVNFASVYVDGKLVGSGSAAQKGMARLNASREALETLARMNMLDDEIAYVEFEVDENNEIVEAKQKLNKICGSNKWPNPSYRVEKVEGTSHDKRYVCFVEVKVGTEVLLVHGEGRSRMKNAEYSAASSMIHRLRESGHVKCELTCNMYPNE